MNLQWQVVSDNSGCSLQTDDSTELGSKRSNNTSARHALLVEIQLLHWLRQISGEFHAVLQNVFCVLFFPPH